MSKTTKQNSVLNITWDDLNKWFGSTIVNRGKSYKEEVSKIGRTKTGVIVAWVQGTRRYATYIRFHEKQRIVSDCSCPFGGMCKHGVALTLVYLDALRAKKDLPLVDENDPRMRLLGFKNRESELNVEEENEEDSAPVKKAKSTKSNKKPDDMRSYLGEIPQSELIDLILQIGDTSKEARQVLMDRKNLARDDVKSILKTLESEIRNVSSGGMSYDDWGDEDDAPNYARIQDLLKQLLDKGHADDVVKLGRELWENGVEQVVNEYQDDFAATYLMECMEIVFKALFRSSLPKSEQLLWLIDIEMEDDYSLIDIVKDPIQAGRFKKTDWSAAADSLFEKLKECAMPKKGINDFSVRYNRGQLVDWISTALEKSGRKSEIIPLLEKETPLTQKYKVLIERLFDAGRKEEAKQWVLRGFNDTVKTAPGIANDMVKQLREMALKEKQYAIVASYDALEFFARPFFQGYKTLKESSEKAGFWPPVREAVHRFMETGQLPKIFPQESAPVRLTQKQPVMPGKSDWPLPTPELNFPQPKFHNDAPLRDLQIEIAIADSNPEEVLRLFQAKVKEKKAKSSYSILNYMDLNVAEFLQKTHPDISLSIWKNQAESLIGQTKVDAYKGAAVYLKKMKSVYQNQKRMEEWNAYLTSLMGQHKNKPRLMEILLGLEGKTVKKKPKKIIEG